jgi:hypothetical protein
MKTRTDLSAGGIWARYLNVLLGAWLFLSDFAWRHGQAASTNTWICGLLVIAFALWAFRMPTMRWWNTALGAWIVIAGFALPHQSAGTQWNNIIVGALVLLISLVPSQPLPDRRGLNAPLP